MHEVKRGEIYLMNFSSVVGSEQAGSRPALILQNNVGNKHSPTTIVAAITSKRTKALLPTHIKIDVEGLEEESIVLLEQIRTVDKRRLMEYTGKLDEKMMDIIDRAILISLGLKQSEGIQDE